MADIYVSGHLAWIKATKNFVPRYATDYRNDISYYEVMKQVYETMKIRNESVLERYAEATFLADKLWYKQMFSLSKSIDKKADKSLPSNSNKWFMTLGFNHATWSIKDCDKCIKHILDMEWIISGKANFELFRSNGEHPHCHFLIETKEPKSRILGKVFRPLYVKKVVFAKNFIDLKPMMDHHLKYINLDKTEDKMILVEKDIVWRKKYGIPDYEKNWQGGVN